MSVVVRVATVEDVEAADWNVVAKALATEISGGMAYIGLIDGAPAAIWGIRTGSLLSHEAYLWMVTSTEAAKHSLTFARHSRRLVEDIAAKFGRVFCYVVADNTRSIKWLEWLGFKWYNEEVAGELRIKMYEWIQQPSQ